MVADAPTLDALLERWGPFVWRASHRYARGFGLDPEEVHAEAVATMVRRFGRFDPGRPNASFPAWALLAVREAANDMRDLVTRRREVRWEHSAEVDRGAYLLDPRAVDPSDVAAESEDRSRTAAAVAAALAALPPRHRAAVTKRFWAGELLASGERERLRKALDQLRELLT